MKAARESRLAARVNRGDPRRRRDTGRAGADQVGAGDHVDLSIWPAADGLSICSPVSSITWRGKFPASDSCLESQEGIAGFARPQGA